MVQGQSLRRGDARAMGRAGLLALAFTLTLVLLLGIWLRPYILSFYHLEVGGQALQEGLVTVFPDRLAPEQVVDGKRLESGAAHLQEAIRWDPRNAQARRNLARVYLSQGQPEAALDALSLALSWQPDNPTLWLEVGDVYDSLGETEEAIKAYQAGHIGSRQAPLTANYLKLATVSWEEGQGEAAIELWRQALQADPGNLHALYRLAKIHREMGDIKTAKTYEEQLRHWDVQSVTMPLDFRLADYQAQAMTGLVEDGLWNRQAMLYVVAYLAERFARDVPGQMTQRMLQTLLERWSEDADLRFYQAELYHRQGELERAEVVYRQVLQAKPGYVSAYLRLAKIAEARQGPDLVQNVQDERVDTSVNRLRNASFDQVRLGGVEDQFPYWAAADFWKQPQARGWSRNVVGNGSPGALEIGLMGAVDRSYRIGVQQPCGERIEPGTRLELQADIWVPEDLQGTYAWAGAVIYDPAGGGSTVFLGLTQRTATAGWKRQEKVGQVPREAERYSCVFLVVLDAEQPVADVRNVARFDNVVLR